MASNARYIPKDIASVAQAHRHEKRAADEPDVRESGVPPRVVARSVPFMALPIVPLADPIVPAIGRPACKGVMEPYISQHPLDFLTCSANEVDAGAETRCRRAQASSTSAATLCHMSGFRFLLPHRSNCDTYVA